MTMMSFPYSMAVMFFPISPTPPKKSILTGFFFLPRSPFSFLADFSLLSPFSVFTGFSRLSDFVRTSSLLLWEDFKDSSCLSVSCAGSFVPFPLARERREGLYPASSIASLVRVSPALRARCSRLYASIPLRIASSMAGSVCLSLELFLPFFKYILLTPPITRRESYLSSSLVYPVTDQKFNYSFRNPDRIFPRPPS